MYRFVSLLLLLFVVAACQSAEQAQPNLQAGDAQMTAAPEADYQPLEAKMAAEPTPATAPATANRYLIYQADLRLQVRDVAAATPRVEALTKQLGGYVSGMNLTNTHYQISNTLTLRVPANRFDSLLQALEKEAVFVSYRRTSSNDVSEEYLDIELRLRTKREVRDRYIDILRNRARTVEEVLKAEEAIRVVQEEIEAREGRLRYLQDQVALSTINLEIYQEVDYQPEPPALRDSFWGRAARGLRNGWSLFVDFAVLLINAWPLVLLGGLAYWQRRRIFRRWYK